MSARAAWGLALALACAPLAAGCAHVGGTGGPGISSGESQPPALDSITVGLWRLDETTGARIADAGPFRLEGTSGTDARPDFGRFGSARRFQRTVQSFVVVPQNPLLQPASGFTCEAWIDPSDLRGLDWFAGVLESLDRG